MINELALCSGYGGFPLGLTLAGVEHRTVCHVERDAHAAAVLVARMGDATLDRAPVWSDLATFDGEPWRGTVDLVTAGFPCQPWSAAGRKRGVDDHRWLWPDIDRIVHEVRPWLVFLENVPGLNRAVDGGGLSFVLQDLADLGFDAEWGLLSAASVGATQRRDRLWLLAVAHGHVDRLQAVWRQSEHHEHAWHHLDGRSSADVADAESGGRDAGLGRPARGRGDEPEGDRFPPRRGDERGWERWIAAGGPEPSLRRSADGVTGRLVKPAGIADQLHLLGNGLVPQVAAEAFAQLSRRFLT